MRSDQRWPAADDGPLGAPDPGRAVGEPGGGARGGAADRQGPARARHRRHGQRAARAPAPRWSSSCARSARTPTCRRSALADAGPAGRYPLRLLARGRRAGRRRARRRLPGRGRPARGARPRRGRPRRLARARAGVAAGDAVAPRSRPRRPRTGARTAAASASAAPSPAARASNSSARSRASAPRRCRRCAGTRSAAGPARCPGRRPRRCRSAATAAPAGWSARSPTRARRRPASRSSTTSARSTASRPRARPSCASAAPRGSCSPPTPGTAARRCPARAARACWASWASRRCRCSTACTRPGTRRAASGCSSPAQEDPLWSEVERPRHLGFLEAFPNNPRHAPHAERRTGLTPLVRTVDLAARRHRVAAGAAPAGAPSLELGALHEEPQPGSIPVWLADDRLVTGDPQPAAGADRRAALRWAAAPLAWRGEGRRPARPARAGRRAPARHGPARPGDRGRPRPRASRRATSGPRATAASGTSCSPPCIRSRATRS